ncbi:MAG: ATP-grasp domain-containing protein [Humidesulfovibrio sp.]|nr:ATP-grasp domain-containing protein [Humidesulfovibrio sp.]
MADASARKVCVLLTSAGVATAVNVMSALRQARSLSCRLVAVDKNPLAVGLYLADKGETVPQAGTPEYLERLLDLARREGAEFIFPLHSSETVFFARNARAFRSAGLRLLVPDPEVAELCADKLLFGDYLAAKGYRHPRTLPLPLPTDARFPLFLKPRSSSSSKNACKVDDKEDLYYLLRKVKDPIVQEYCPGREYTVDCLRHAGCIYACAPRVRVLVKDGKSMVGLTVDHPALEAEVRRLLDDLDYEGPCNVQCIEDEEGGISIIEINPRLAAGGLPLTVRAGANIPEMMVRLGLGLGVAPVDKVRPGVYMLRYLDEVFTEKG